MGGVANRSYKLARKAAVAVVGVFVIVLGIILIPLPGPGTLIILGGLAILATEFEVARRALDRLKARFRAVVGRPEPPADDADSA